MLRLVPPKVRSFGEFLTDSFRELCLRIPLGEALGEPPVGEPPGGEDLEMVLLRSPVPNATATLPIESTECEFASLTSGNAGRI